MSRLIKHFGEASALTTDTPLALLCTFKKLRKDNYYTPPKHCTIKPCNNLI